MRSIRKGKIVSAILLTLGVCVAAATVFTAAYFVGASPTLLGQPQQAQNSVAQIMDRLCQGDFFGAGAYMLGQPELGVQAPQDAVGAMLWDAYVDSLSYELVGQCYATESGLAQKIRFSCLDLQSVTANLKQTATEMLEQRVEAAEDVSQIYDENLEYREDVVMEVMEQAVRAVLEQYGKNVSVELVVALENRDGQWKILADTAFVDAVFGDVLF